MATKVSAGKYQVGRDESISVTVTAVGTGFSVSSSFDSQLLHLQNNVPLWITPQQLDSGSRHLMDLLGLFPGAAGQYKVVVSDQAGVQLEVFTLTPANAEVLFQFVVA